MDEGFKTLTFMIIATIIFLFASSFALRIYDTGLDYNRVVVEDTHHKASSRYELPSFYEPVLYITPTDAFTDIINSDSSVTEMINGSALDPTIISKAANGDSIAIAAIKSALDQTRYHKVTGYDRDGNKTYINFIGD